MATFDWNDLRDKKMWLRKATLMLSELESFQSTDELDGNSGT
jgi:hypothetical protein